MNTEKKPREPKAGSPNNPVDTLFYEKKAVDKGARVVAGVDEAGRGPLAGPVVAGAVVIRDASFTTRIDDSKKLSERMREKALVQIMGRCDVGIGVASVEEIDRLNIYNATLLAMKRAVGELSAEPDVLLIDGTMNIPLFKEKVFLTRGESKSMSIACASIAAKVYRDRLMLELDREYPQYGFSRHKGYGTASHMEAIRKHGLSPVHRASFGPFGGKIKGEDNEL